MNTSYREHFRAEGAARAYDQEQYALGSYWDLLWTLERPLLDEVARRLTARGRAGSYLDFACGTGRLLAHLEGHFQSATGVDVSAEMLGRARDRVQRARLLNVDLTRSGETEERFDLITAFRFLLNAEPSLRSVALGALSRRLRDSESLLVVNTHGNPLSFKLLARPVKWIRARLGGPPDERYLASGEVLRLLAGAGLEVVERLGMGVLPWRFWKWLPRGLALASEKALTRVPGLWRLGVNQIFVCRLLVR